MEWKKKSNTAYIATGVMAGICLLFVAAFYGNKAFLAEGMMYRIAVEVVGALISWLVFPILLYAFLWFFAGYKLCGERFLTVRLVLRLVSGIFWAVYLFFASLILLNYIVDIGTEEEIAPGILRTNSHLLGEYNSYSYEKEQGVLYKCTYEPMSDIALLLMEKKYHEKFVVVSSEENTWVLSPAALPELFFTIRRLDSAEDGLDDYPVMRAAYRMKKESETLCPEREITVEKGYYDYGKELEIVCTDKEDARQCSEDVAALIAKTLEDDFFKAEDREITLQIVCAGEEGNTKNVTLYFGNQKNGKTQEYNTYDYYTDAELIYKKLFYVWDELESESLSDAGEQETAESDAADALQEKYEASPYYIEGAYKVLYEELFAGQGYPYRPGYNAKGNFYAWLCEGYGQPENTEGDFEYQETVVYDRESKNDKCHLFVHYRTYYQDGSEYTTAILDMYAVDMGTGAVYTSGRHAWADVGTQDYREATGEP